MLKLEKISKTRELSVLLRAKPTLLTGSFRIALAYAVFVHLLAFLLFKIAPLSMKFQYTLFPPVNVAVDGLVSHGVDVVLENEEPIPEYLLLPKQGIPELFVDMTNFMRNHTEYIPWQSPLDDPFLAFQHQVEFPTEPEADAASSMSIHLTGGITELSLAKESDIKRNALGLEGKQPHRYVFRVLVEQKQGEIFWWEFIDTESSKTQLTEALNILDMLKFVPLSEPGILSGKVEVMVML